MKTPAAVVVALAIPLVLIVNGIRVAANDWYVRHEYDRLDLPRELEPLALAGLHAITPGGRGIAPLRSARLPDGSQAFTGRERRHLQDVRTQLGRIYLAHLVAVALVVAGALLLGRRALRALHAGAVLTLASAALLGAYILVGFDSFFTGFHRLFFEGDTWRFASSDTLIRLYPERFWNETAIFLATATVAQALLLFGLSWWLSRRLRA